MRLRASGVVMAVAAGLMVASMAVLVIAPAVGAVTRNGTSKNDVLRGGKGADKLAGRAGNDKLFGGAGNDKLSGGKGNDKLDGGKGKDKLIGGPGRDVVLLADGRKDTVNCGSGRDRVKADALDVLKGCEKKSVVGVPPKAPGAPGKPVAPRGPAVPASWLNRFWECLNTRVLYDGSPPFKFRLLSNGTWEDHTFAPSQIRTANYTYDSAGTLRLFSTQATKLYAFIWATDVSGNYLEETDETAAPSRRFTCRE